jgi:hypothetical protein
VKHEKGGANDHIAPKRQLVVALCSDLVAMATTLRQSSGGVFRFGAMWSFSPPDGQVAPMLAGRRRDDGGGRHGTRRDRNDDHACSSTAQSDGHEIFVSCQQVR